MNHTTLHDTSLAVVGAGAMGEAMLGGLLARHLIEPRRVVCSHPRAERRAALEEAHGVLTTPSNAAAVADAGLVLLAVKPQMLAGVMHDLRGSLHADQLVVSVIAGASTHALGEGLKHRAVVRSMPNTPARIGEGVTVWYATPEVDERSKQRVRTVFGALGREFEVEDERQVAMATAVSGTGPMYIFMFIEALTDAAVHLGFPRHVARELVLDTMSGSASFALQSGKHVAELRDMVTSPGGTSAEALYQLEKGGLRTVVSDAVWAAFERTLALEARLEGGEEPPRPHRRR
ncbi:MAG: pyrroline-5-carboxylate reductase [Candidatus Dormibacteria bacterium]